MEAQPTDPYATLGVPRTATQGEIRKAYLQLVREHPPEADPEAFARINDAYAILGNAEKRAAFDAAPVWPADALESAKEAVAAAQAERFVDACRTLEPVVAKHPGFEPLGRLYGQALLGAERYADALPIWRRAVDARPDEVGALYAFSIAVGAGGKGDMEEATRLLKHAITLAPDDPECAIGLGRTYLRMGRAEDAAAAFARGMERHPDPGPARLAFRVEILRGARFVPASADGDAARARLKNDLARVDDPVRQHALSRLWRVARDFRREGRLDVAAALFDDFADVGPPKSRAAEAAETLRAFAAYRADLARLRADASRPRWLKEMAEAFDLDRDDETKRARLTEFAESRAESEPALSRAQGDLEAAADDYPAVIAVLLEPFRNACAAAALFRSRPDISRLFVDPRVAEWIKELAFVECGAAEVKDGSERRNAIRGYMRDHRQEAIEEFAAAREGHPSATKTLRVAYENALRGSGAPSQIGRPLRLSGPAAPTWTPIGRLLFVAFMFGLWFLMSRAGDRQLQVLDERVRRNAAEHDRTRAVDGQSSRKAPARRPAVDGR